MSFLLKNQLKTISRICLKNMFWIYLHLAKNDQSLTTFYCVSLTCKVKRTLLYLSLLSPLPLLLQRVVQATCVTVVTEVTAVMAVPVELLKLQQTATLRPLREPSATWRLAGLAIGCCLEMQTNTPRRRAPDRSTRSSSRPLPPRCHWWSLQVSEAGWEQEGGDTAAEYWAPGSYLMYFCKIQVLSSVHESCGSNVLIRGDFLNENNWILNQTKR